MSHETNRWTGADAGAVEMQPAVERLLARFLRERFPQADGRKLADSVRRLSDAFTAERSELPGSYLNHPPSRSAYLAFFHPQQVLRGIAAIGESRKRAVARGLWPTREPLRVLDLGAGLGAMSQALLCAGGLPQRIEFTLVDHQKSALADAREILVRTAAELRPDAPPPLVRFAAATLYEWLGRAHREGWTYDVILLGGVLNEVAATARVGGGRDPDRNRRASDARDDAERDDEADAEDEADGSEDDGADDGAPEVGPWTRIVSRVLDRAEPGGVVIAVEPALPPVARALMQAREDLLGRTTTIAPCTHAAPCPLLALRKDWCFTTRPVRLPRRVREMAERLRHQTAEVRFAFWAAAPRPDAAPPEHVPRDFVRVVSDPVLGGQVLCRDGARDRLPGGAGPFARGTLLRRAPPSGSA